MNEWHLYRFNSLLVDVMVYTLATKWSSTVGSNGFPGSSDGKDSTCSVGDLGSIPGLGRFPEEGNGYTLQCSCLENSIDRGAWLPIVCGVTKSLT